MVLFSLLSCTFVEMKRYLLWLGALVAVVAMLAVTVALLRPRTPEQDELKTFNIPEKMSEKMLYALIETEKGTMKAEL